MTVSMFSVYVDLLSMPWVRGRGCVRKLMVFGRLVARYSVSGSLLKTRRKYVPVGSLLPSMATDGLEKSSQSPLAMYRYRDLIYLGPMLSALTSNFALDFSSIRNSTFSIPGGVSAVSMQSWVGMHTGFQRLSVWITTGIMGQRMKDHQPDQVLLSKLQKNSIEIYSPADSLC